MPSWATQRNKSRRRDGNQCQICGDTLVSPYCQLQVHHIRARADGGTDDLDNLVTLCDLCHAICHWHLGPAWCGLFKMPFDRQAEARTTLAQTRQEFHAFLLLPLTERHAIQDQLWARWSVTRQGEGL